MHLSDITNVVADLDRIAAVGNLHLALAYLNGFTTARYTGMYRFDGDLIRSIDTFDREHPNEELSLAAPAMSSYCSLVAAAREPFLVSDSLGEPRVMDHMSRDVWRSYVGVPLIHEGRLFGTICHYDHLPHPMTVADVQLLLASARVLIRFATSTPE